MRSMFFNSRLMAQIKTKVSSKGSSRIRRLFEWPWVLVSHRRAFSSVMSSKNLYVSRYQVQVT